ncbi:MAG: hypothetical protein QXU67_06165, partial [Candidatus Bathyarchaeia archaeon]
ITDPSGRCTFLFGGISHLLQSGVIIIFVDNYGTRNFKAIPVLGSSKTIILKPNGPGEYQNWNVIPNSQSHVYATSDDNDTSYIWTQLEGKGKDKDKETMEFENIDKILIQSVTAYARCKAINLTKGGNKYETVSIIWRTYDTNIESNRFIVDRTTWQNYWETMLTNPRTRNAWTWEEVNKLQVGVKASDLEQHGQEKEEMRCSELWLEVRYVGMSAPSYLSGRTLFVDKTLTPLNPSKLTVREVLTLIRNGEISFREVTFSLYETGEIVGGKVAYDIEHVESSAVIVLAAFKNGSLPYTVYASREVDFSASRSYRTISSIYPKEGSKEFPISAYAERVVKIGGCTYIVRLYIWRMSY